MSTEPTASSPAPNKGKPGIAWGPIVIIALILCGIAGGVYYAFMSDSKKLQVADNSGILKSFIIKFKSDLQLKEGLVDANNDGIADSPTDPKSLLKPSELKLIVIAGEDHVKSAEMWKPLLASMSQKAGVPVQYLVDYPWPRIGPYGAKLPPEVGPVAIFDEQNDLFSQGLLHICAYSTGQVPIVVGTQGFLPLVCPADENGNLNQELEIIVPADSPIQSPKDLKGKELTLTSLSANAGGRAPLVILKEEFGMSQGKDYGFRIGGNDTKSILGVCYGLEVGNEYQVAKNDEERANALKIETPGKKLDAAAVPSDVLKRYVAQGIIKPDQFKSIYKSSKPFPSLCFGVRNDLDPKLREAVLNAFLEYKIQGSPLESRFPGKTKFVKVDYKKDWAVVQEIDEKFTKLLDK